MRYRQLGASELHVSPISLGCMSYGEPSRGKHSWTLPAEQSGTFIAQALDLGINFFDTANVYSLGSSEEILGNALARLAHRDQVVIATKVFEPMTEDPRSGGLSRQAIMRELDASLRRLRTDYLDLYIIHRWDPHTPIEETMSALHDAVCAGKVRYLGASSMHAWQFAKAQHCAQVHGWTQFVSMQNHYNLINREEEREMLPFCADNNVAVTPWSPLARGRLTRDPDAPTERAVHDQVQEWLYDSSDMSDKKIIAAVKTIAAQRSVPRASVALAWLLRQPAVVSPIVGATAPHHLRDAVAAIELSLTDAEIRSLESPYTPHKVLEYV